jgi:hypothetical protein
VLGDGVIYYHSSGRICIVEEVCVTDD